MRILNIRGIDEDVARAFSAGAASRGWTQAEYLKQLLRLHSFVRLDYRGERWVWSSRDGSDSWPVLEEDEMWVPGETDPVEFVAELGRYLSRQKLLAVTT
jgi:hypothetical protein